MTSPATHPPRSVGRALRYQHRLIWAPALAGLLLAGLLVALLPRTYTATATLALDEQQVVTQGFDVAMQADQYLSGRYLAMATSQPVLQRACTHLRSDCTPSSLGRSVRASTTRTTGQIAITASASSPSDAAAAANAVATEVLHQNEMDTASALAPTKDFLQSQLKQLGDRQQSLQQQAQSGSAVANAQLAQVEGQYTTAANKLQELQVQQVQLNSALRQQQAAQPPSRPSDPDPFRYLPIGLAGGLLVGFLLALLAERFDGRVRDADDVAAATGTDLVLDLRAGGHAAAAEFYTLLHRTQLLGQLEGGRDILLVAAGERDRVDEVGRSLARAAAAEGKRVLLQLTGKPDPRAPREEPGLVVQARGGRSGERSGFDVLVTCRLSPTVDPDALLLAGAGAQIVVAATEDGTDFDQARRTASLLRRAGGDVAMAILLPAGRLPAGPPAGRPVLVPS